MLEIVFTNKMKRDAKLMKKRGKDMTKLTDTLDLLASQVPMPNRYRDHQLSGNLIFDDKLILSASATGTHSDLFSD